MDGEPLPDISGYSNNFGASKNWKSGAGRPSGGVAVYVADDIQVEAWKSRGDDGVQWVKIKIGGVTLMVASCYLPPLVKKTREAIEYDEYWFSEIEREITQAQRLANAVIVSGDINARVKEADDFAPTTTHQSEPSISGMASGDMEAVCTVRRSADKGSVDERARRLLQLCMATNMRIGNGRLNGDVPAVATSVGHGTNTGRAASTSVVDLFLLCPRAMQMASRLQVGPPQLGGSDHNSVCLTLAVQSRHSMPVETEHEPVNSNEREEEEVAETVNEFDLKSASIEAFVEKVKAKSNKLLAVKERVVRTPGVEVLESAANDIEQIWVEALEEAGFQRRPARQQHTKHENLVRMARLKLIKKRRKKKKKVTAQQVAIAGQQLRRAQARKERQKRWRRHGQELENLLFSNPKAYYERIRGATKSKPSSLSAAAFQQFIKKLLNPSPTTQEAATGTNESVEQSSISSNVNSILQQEFTETEFTQAAKQMKNGKAVVGVLKPVLLKAVVDIVTPVLVPILNACVSAKSLPTAWAKCWITAVPKPGADATSCDGHRGIAVGTLLGKAYAWMLNTRLSEWAEDNNKRAAGQFGFRSGHSTQHATFVLRSIVDKLRAEQKKKHVFTCFVDFKKAYDSVPRHLLWRKLEKIGVQGWALQAIQALYTQVPMQVKTGLGLSSTFLATIGLKQGCPLSPLLFGLYIDDLEKELAAAAAEGLDFVHLNNVVVYCLLYADDLALMALTAEGLQKQMMVLQRFARDWGLTINVTKTKSMVFGKGSQSREKLQIKIDDIEVEEVTAFTYLGTYLHRTKSITSAMEPRAKKGIAAMYNVKRTMKQLGVTAPKVLLKMFQVMVEPVLSYGAENFAAQFFTTQGVTVGSDDCQKVQLRFCKELLGVNNGTSNRLALAECGQWPLLFKWFKRTLNFYNSMICDSKSPLIEAAVHAASQQVQAAVQNGRPVNTWLGHIAAALHDLGVDFDIVDLQPVDVGNCCRLWKRKYIERFADDSTTAKQYVEHVRPNNTYSNLPEYLLQESDVRRRCALTQLRLGAHWLRVCVEESEAPHEVFARRCKKCGSGCHSQEIFKHFVFDCTHLACVREECSGLFESENPNVREFFKKDAAQLMSFATKCYKRLCRIQ